MVFGVAMALPVVAALGFYLGSRDSMSLPYDEDTGPTPASQQAALTSLARPVDAVALTEPVLPQAPTTQIAQDTTQAKTSKTTAPKDDGDEPPPAPNEAPASSPPEMDTPAAPEPPKRPDEDPPF